MMIGEMKLKRLLKTFSESDRVLLIIKPDPDSIASALALKNILLKNLIRHATICRTTDITRLENTAMVRLLNIELEPFEKISLENFNKFCILDAQPGHVAIPSLKQYDVIIDHHRALGGYQCRFRDIRPSYGATSSILTEYLFAANLPLTTQLATALAYGIKTDTDNFERPSRDEDLWAFRALFPRADKNILRTIEFSQFSMEFLSFFKIALEKLNIVKNKVTVYLGNVPSPDILVQLADFLIRLDGIYWSIVSGIYKDSLVIIFRNAGHKHDAGKSAQKAFEEWGNAGGHRWAARAEIPINNLIKKFKVLDEITIEAFISERLKQI